MSTHADTTFSSSNFGLTKEEDDDFSLEIGPRTDYVWGTKDQMLRFVKECIGSLKIIQKQLERK